MSTKRKSKSQRSGDSCESDDCGELLALSELRGELPSASIVKNGHGRHSQSPYDDSTERDASSPGDGSISSGPIYIRTPGFKNHAHAIQISSTDHVLKKNKAIRKKSIDENSVGEEDGTGLTAKKIGVHRAKQPKGRLS